MTEHARLLDELESLLAKQLALVQSEGIDDLLPCVERAGKLADLLGPVATPERAERDPQIQRICRLHRQLCLALAARKHELARKLSRIRNGKDALRTYRGTPRR